MFESRPFAVAVRATQNLSFVVDAHTSEEAESIVEAYLEDGETGTITSQTFSVVDAYPVEAPEEIDAPQSARRMTLAELDGDETFEATAEVFN